MYRMSNPREGCLKIYYKYHQYFSSVYEKYINLCNVYDLKTDKLMSANLTSLETFSLQAYTAKLKEWKIAYHTNVLENLSKVY